MQFAQFLTQFQPTDTSWHTPVMCFTGNAYPVLLFPLIAANRERYGISQSIMIDMSSDVNSYRSALETLFLGQRCWYFLSAREEPSASARTAWITYLQTYRGPHTIWFFIKEAPAKQTLHWTICAIPEHVDKRLFTQLRVFCGEQESSERIGSKFTDQLYEHERIISLDMAFMMIRYASLAGMRNDEFFDTWVSRLIPYEESLFSLSQALFAKQPQKFFEQWNCIASLYVSQFWLTFWSEQLWRAACYINTMSHDNAQEARKIGYRLPFLYLKRDWKNYSVTELQRAHHALYQIDFNLKHGASDIQLDIFFNAFLQNKFRDMQS